MTLIAAYLIAVICIILIPLLLTLWTALRRQQYINRYYTNRNSEMNTEILNMQKEIKRYGKEIEQRKQGKGRKEGN